MALRKSGAFGCALVLLTVALVGTSCSLGQAEPTAVPFVATPYAPDESGADTGAATENTPADSAENASGDRADETDNDAADDAQPVAEAAAGNAAAQPDNASAAAPAVVAPNGTALRYNGEIAAERQVVVVAETAGMVLALPVDVGDRIAEGQTLAELDTTLLAAQKEQALAGLAAAQAQLDLLNVEADPDDIAAAEAAVSAANAAYQRAVSGATDEERRLALAQLKQAEAAVTVAQAGYNRVKGNPAIGALPESLQLQQATLGLEAAQAQYDKVLKGTTQDVIAGAYAQLAQARAALQRLQEGAKDEQVRAAEAQVHQAEMAVYLAQLQISKATVKAPVAGVVSRVNSAEGAMAGPGTPLVTLLSREVKITIAVEETRLPQLQLGLPAQIRVDAYPDRLFAGEVAIIAPELDPATRTVEVTIRPNEETGLLAPGMFATVELGLP
ncbi:MAG: efflux RND transporter periplasmic adaptor subunit [Caldilineaceae bacterium]|nr:efflux RND transporter periplasmic adaptor subunit [Caldilineaceae bacterium]